MMFRDAGNLGRGVVPPLLGKKEPLVGKPIRPILPFLGREPLVMRQGDDAWCALRVGTGATG